ncbi:hypothetical protein CEXT_726021 [Caerostris extrusa]|uniref:Ycf15 n=1 Tax=Caerostris extrusa TaxID=172846 RepID=A0AAV4M8L2_CAEEX|nr:hypothetical protein CEXT_726021 [Caerostris extrusa]
MPVIPLCSDEGIILFRDSRMIDEGGERQQKHWSVFKDSIPLPTPHPGVFCSNPQNVFCIFMHKHPPRVWRKEIGRGRRRMDEEERNVALIFVCYLKGGFTEFSFSYSFSV